MWLHIPFLLKPPAPPRCHCIHIWQGQLCWVSVHFIPCPCVCLGAELAPTNLLMV